MSVKSTDPSKYYLGSGIILHKAIKKYGKKILKEKF